MKYIIAILLCLFSFSAQATEIIYLNCNPQIVQPILSKIKRDVKRFCGDKEPEKITFVSCKKNGESVHISVTYRCKDELLRF